MIIELCFWIAGALALRTIHPAAAAGFAGGAIAALVGMAFDAQGIVALALTAAILWTRHVLRTQTPVARAHRDVPERPLRLGRVRQVSDSGVKRYCLVETEGRLMAAVAACYEPVAAGDEVRVIGETREGLLVQLRAPKVQTTS